MTSDKWVWTDGTPVIYTNWDKKQPDNWHGEEACTHMFNHDTDPAAKRWNDVNCNKKMSSFVCKFKTPRN
ncbi:hypothetical protein COOONC_10092 [Cooperia oncophora]